MKKLKNLALLAALTGLLLTSCEKDDSTPKTIDITGVYLLNFGTYGGAEGSLSTFNYDNQTLSSNAYRAANNDVAMQGNPQYAYEYKGNIYFLGNDKDEVYFVDKYTLKQTKNGITDNLVKPRFCVGHNDYLYISCWGGDVWFDSTVSYIAVYNIKTNTVDKKIPLVGGPEGLEIANNKLYCALNYQNKIAVMDLSTEEFTYIDELPAFSSYFLKDKESNLYVSLVGSYSVPAVTSGIGYINTKTNTLEKIFELDDVSQGYASIMDANSNFTKLYVLASAYDANYNLTGAVHTLDIASGTYDTTPLITDVAGLNGVSVNPENDDVFVMISQSAAASGELMIFDNKGLKTGTYETGIAPAWALFIE